MLTFLDLQMLYENRNRPGRFTLVDYKTKAFLLTANESAGLIHLNLPRPQAGYCRLWVSLDTFSNGATPLLVFLRWLFSPDDPDPGVKANYLATAAAPTPIYNLSLIGGGTTVYAAASTAIHNFRSMEPLLVTDADHLQVVWTTGVGSGDVATLRGRYLDMPC